MTYLNKNTNAEHNEFEEIALPHMRYIYQISYKFTGNKEAAEDLTQETFTVAMQKFNQLKDPKKCKSWLFVIARNLFLSVVTKMNNKYFLDYEDVSYMIPDNSQGADRFVQNGYSDNVQHHMDRLSPKYREPFEMAVLGDYSYKEIAKELDIPIGTVMSRIARGKAFLKREIGKNCESYKDCLT